MAARLCAALFRLSVASCIFLAFGWPFLVSPDPEGGAFRIVAIASLVAFLALLACEVAFKMARGTDEPRVGG